MRASSQDSLFWHHIIRVCVPVTIAADGDDLAHISGGAPVGPWGNQDDVPISRGIDGLLNRPQQLRSDAGSVFDNTYRPVKSSARLVDTNYPVEDVDFRRAGPYSQYNWELFFHAPLLIANSLRQNQRFEDAQRWFHYIFDPTDSSSLSSPQRFWRTKPFFLRGDVEYQRQHITTIMRMLVDAGYIRWAKIAYFDEDRQEWRVIHPEEETDFSLLSGSPDDREE